MSVIPGLWDGITRNAGLSRRLAAAWDAWVDLPLVMHVGLLIIAGGTLFDIWAHWSAGDLSPVTPRFTPFERLGHWVVLLGMVVSILGVVVRGYRRPVTPTGGPQPTR